MLVCSIDLKKDIDKRPVVKQLLYSLVKYMQTDAFDPESNLCISVLDEIFNKSNMHPVEKANLANCYYLAYNGTVLIATKE